MSRALRCVRLPGQLAFGLGAAAVLAYSLPPFIWIFIGSITPEATPDANTAWSSARAAQYLPTPTLANYVSLFSESPFLLYLRNSVIVATGTMALAGAVGSLAAYGFVRFRFFLRRTLLVSMLMAYMIPSVVLLVPLLVIFRSYGLVNTYVGLILAETTNNAPFVMLLMINYFATLPADLEEAAQVDGCGRLQALLRIVMPLAIPGLVAGCLFAFITAWNHFLFAYLLTSTNDVKTLPVILRQMALGEPAVWGVSTAAAVVTTLPPAILFLAFQRLLIGGLAAGAVKG
jgi:ABC-type glycerol-3-phosphate transport system permease component